MLRNTHPLEPCYIDEAECFALPMFRQMKQGVRRMLAIEVPELAKG